LSEVEKRTSLDTSVGRTTAANLARKASEVLDASDGWSLELRCNVVEVDPQRGQTSQLKESVTGLIQHLHSLITI